MKARKIIRKESTHQKKKNTHKKVQQIVWKLRRRANTKKYNSECLSNCISNKLAIFPFRIFIYLIVLSRFFAAFMRLLFLFCMEEIRRHKRKSISDSPFFSVFSIGIDFLGNCFRCSLFAEIFSILFADIHHFYPAHFNLPVFREKNISISDNGSFPSTQRIIYKMTYTIRAIFSPISMGGGWVVVVEMFIQWICDCCLRST